jgi:hypothetical protein
MMGLREDFEPTRAALLSRSPLPSLVSTVKELISEENRLPHHHLSSSNVVLATPRPPASSFDRPRRIYKYCKKPGHDITEYYRKKKDDKRKQHQSHDTFPRLQAAAVSFSPVDDPVVTVSQLENMFHRYMSQPSPALSVTLGNKPWLLDSACCNHMTPHASHFSQKTPLAPSPIIYIVDSSHITYLYCTHNFAYIKAIPCIGLLTEYIIQIYFAHFQSLFSLSLLILNSFEVIALIRFVHMCNCFLLVINYCFLIFPNFHRFSTSLF